MAGLREAGLEVPRDVSVVGIDGIYLAGLSNPGLTTVRLPVREMAQAMVQRAMRTEAPPDATDTDRVFPPERLVERDSVAAPPVRQRTGAILENKTIS